MVISGCLNLMKGVPPAPMRMTMMSSVILVMSLPVVDGYQMHRLWTMNADSKR